jgi:hypothetical protein
MPAAIGAKITERSWAEQAAKASAPPASSSPASVSSLSASASKMAIQEDEHMASASNPNTDAEDGDEVDEEEENDEEVEEDEEVDQLMSSSEDEVVPPATSTANGKVKNGTAAKSGASTPAVPPPPPRIPTPPLVFEPSDDESTGPPAPFTGTKSKKPTRRAGTSYIPDEMLAGILGAERLYLSDIPSRIVD